VANSRHIGVPTCPSRFIFSHSRAQRCIVCRDARGSTGGGVDGSTGGRRTGGASFGALGSGGRAGICAGACGAGVVDGGRCCGRRGGAGTAFVAFLAGACCVEAPPPPTCPAGCAWAHSGAIAQRRTNGKAVQPPGRACPARRARATPGRAARWNSISCWGTYLDRELERAACAPILRQCVGC
jgi:hypothetical protein